MRVCQFRHFGNGRIRPASKAEHRNRETLVFQKEEPVSIMVESLSTNWKKETSTLLESES